MGQLAVRQREGRWCHVVLTKKSELHLMNGVDLFVREAEQTHSSRETVRC